MTPTFLNLTYQMTSTAVVNPPLNANGHLPGSVNATLGEHSPSKANFNGRMIHAVDTSNSKIRNIALTATRPLRILCAIITDLFIAIVLGLMCVLSYINLDPSTPDTSRTPVLFLHGVNHNQSGLLFGQLLLRGYSALRGQKLGSFYSISYAGVLTNGRHETFDTYADKVFQKVHQIYKETHQLPTLVGHSMGGLVSTSLAKKCAEAIESGVYRFENGDRMVLSDQEKEALHLSNIITLGTPFHGSYAADVFCDLHQKVGAKAITVYQDMMTDSRKCDRLAELRNFAVTANNTGRLRYYNVGSTVDAFVPKGYFVTTDPASQYEAYHLGHLGLLCSPLVWSKVHKWLVECESGQV